MRFAVAIAVLGSIAAAAIASCGAFGTSDSSSNAVPDAAAAPDAPFEGIEASAPTCPETCGALNASCGTDLDNGCGKTLNCGACDAGTCQAQDGGFACSIAPCISDPEATCKDRCKTVNDNCAKPTDCGSCTNATDLCGGGGSPTKCGCPARTLTLHQFGKATAAGIFHCYSQGFNGCLGFSYEGPVATLHSFQYDGLVPLYRCRANIGPQKQYDVYILTTSPTCAGNPNFAFQGLVGYCKPGAAVCSSFTLRTYFNTVNGDYQFKPASAAPAPPYTYAGDVCDVWP